MIRKAPLGDPIEFLLKGYNLSLRKAESDNVYVSVKGES
jgi:Fe2+ transport system protein FeoA